MKAPDKSQEKVQAQGACKIDYKDFNSTHFLFLKETFGKFGTTGPGWLSSMFQLLISDECGFVELSVVGFKYTKSNMNLSTELLLECLDIVLTNVELLDHTMMIL